MNLRWEDEAQLELSEAAIHYYFEEPGLDERFITHVEAAAEKIMRDPMLPREFEAPYRKIKTEVFPYQLIYAIEGDTVWIIAVMHQSRKPDYWKDRR